MQVRLYLKVGWLPQQVHRDIDWPASLALPDADDFVTVGELELEVDHREFFPESPTGKPMVGLAFMDRTDLSRDDAILEGWS